MAISKYELGFIFLVTLVLFIMFVGWHYYGYEKKTKYQEKIYKELWKKYYGKKDKKSKKP